ncbi:translation initiation factor 3 subunit 3 [Pisolithus marmoratus]|nr:translation initiation factor 3 subunit 3 [Pisolithus marmoratus]
MAAALAASLPAPSAVTTPAAPTYEAIPPSMSTAIDVEAEIPLTCVQLDGLVVSKIIQHSQDTSLGSAHGLLLGLDLEGTLEVSNSFPLPNHANDDDEKMSKSLARYQTSMLRSLREVQGDDNVVGFYQATSLGAFYNQSLIDTQAIHQERLRHGGVVIVHDVSQTARGTASFRAFKLTPSFMDMYKKSNFSASSLVHHRLTFSSILEEVPLRIRTNPLLGSFLNVLAAPSSTSPYTSAYLGSPATSAIPPSYSVLDLGHSGLARNLEHVAEGIDNYRTEEGNVAYASRQIAREKSRLETHLAKRREENAQRVSQGLNPLPEEDMGRTFKIPPEPSRLDSLLLLGQLDAYAKTLESAAGLGLAKMYAARAGHA